MDLALHDNDNLIWSNDIAEVWKCKEIIGLSCHGNFLEDFAMCSEILMWNIVNNMKVEKGRWIKTCTLLPVTQILHLAITSCLEENIYIIRGASELATLKNMTVSHNLSNFYATFDKGLVPCVMLGKQPYPMKTQANFWNFRWNRTLENGGLYREYRGFFNCPHKVRITDWGISKPRKDSFLKHAVSFKKVKGRPNLHQWKQC